MVVDGLPRAFLVRGRDHAHAGLVLNIQAGDAGALPHEREDRGLAES